MYTIGFGAESQANSSPGPAHRFPAELDYPVYPGHAAGSPYTFSHQLTLMTRAVVLFVLAGPDSAAITADLTTHAEHLSSIFPAIDGYTGAPLGLERGRLFAPKILAKPAELSRGEYTGLEMALSGFLTRQGGSDTASIVSALGECHLVRCGCPELRNYTGEK